MSNYTASQSSKKKPNPRYRTPDSFVESLKSIGSSTISQGKDATVGAVSSQTRRLFGLPEGDQQPDQNAMTQAQFESEWQHREAVIRSQERSHADRVKASEKTIFDEREQKIALQINAVRQELKALIASMGQMAQDIDTAITQEIVNPGVYHVNFFDKLIKRLKRLKNSIHDSRSWLTLHKDKASTRQGYWGQVKKSGTKFMLSHERTVATQTG